jgi:VCBS repeat-containing protein
MLSKGGDVRVNPLARPTKGELIRCLVLAATAAVVLLAAAGASWRAGLGPVQPAAFRGGAGYWLLAKDGGVFAFGDAPYFGPNRNQGHDIVGLAATPTGDGYWTCDDDGDVFAYGDATDYGSRPGPKVNDIAAFAARAQGDGYWMVAKNGAVYAFGGAAYYGGANTVALSQGIVGMSATPSGKGYWLLGADGGVFAYGDAGYYGSTGAMKLNQSIVDLSPTPGGLGYRFIGGDGGVFAYGDAGFFGSTGAMKLNHPIVGVATTASGQGYWLAGRDGGVFAFGDAGFFGSTGGMKLEASIVAIVATPRVKVGPTARADSATVAEDGSVTIDVLANDGYRGPASVSVTGTSANGTASVKAGQVVYAPKPDFFGSDALTYRLTDATGFSETAQVQITVTPVNDPPVAAGASRTVPEDGSVSGTLSATDVDSATLTFSIVTPPAHGSLTAFTPATGAYTYKPDADFGGSDAFTFRANDGHANSNTATVTVTVNPVNDAPVIDGDASDLAPSGDEDTVIAGTVAASDVDTGDTLTFSVEAGNGPAHGTVTIDPDTGEYAYTPDGDFHGTDTFTVTVTDTGLLTDTAAVTLTVNPVNDPPVVDEVDSDLSVTVDEDDGAGVSGTIVATDIDGDTLTFTIEAGDDAAHGTVTGLGATGTYLYVPDPDHEGADTFTVTISDGNGATTTATVTVTVNPVNDAPVIDPDSDVELETFLDLAVAGTIVALDVDGDVLTFSVEADGLPAHGTVTGLGVGVGAFLYTPALGYFGPDSFTVTVTDGNGGTATVVVNVTVALL